MQMACQFKELRESSERARIFVAEPSCAASPVLSDARPTRAMAKEPIEGQSLNAARCTLRLIAARPPPHHPRSAVKYQSVPARPDL